MSVISPKSSLCGYFKLQVVRCGPMRTDAVIIIPILYCVLLAPPVAGVAVKYTQ